MVSASYSGVKDLDQVLFMAIVLCSWQAALISSCLSPHKGIMGVHMSVKCLRNVVNMLRVSLQ